MGQEDNAVISGLNPINQPPKSDEVEVSLFGPGYGECALIHIGNDDWVIVDSCLNSESQPAALAYLRGIGANPANVVRLIVATHWHDDHIRGVGEMVELCRNASFCCAGALSKTEFLAAVGALESDPATPNGSGTRELYKAFSLLEQRNTRPVFAFANRRIFNRNGCEVWSLSPFDKEYAGFLLEIGNLVPKDYETKIRIPSLTPNKVAVVLLIKVDETVLLLGSDLERSGWLEILGASERPNWKASVFKVPHHGSDDAHEERVWSEMLLGGPMALLAPWQRGGRELPTKGDVQRILSYTPAAYSTTLRINGRARVRNNAVQRTIREMGANIRRIGSSFGMIRLRKRSDAHIAWNIETFGLAGLLTA